MSARKPKAGREPDHFRFWTQGAATVRAESLRCFKDLVTSLGGDPVALLEAVGAEQSLLDPSDAQLPYRQLIELFEVASTQLACPDFGMRLAAFQAAQGATKVLGPLEVAMRNSPTLGCAYRYCSQHLHAYDTVTQLCIEKFAEDPRIFMLLDTILLGGRISAKRSNKRWHSPNWA